MSSGSEVFTHFLDVPLTLQPQPHATGFSLSLPLGTFPSSLWAPAPSSEKWGVLARGIPRVLSNSDILGFWLTSGPLAAQYRWQTNGCQRIPRDTQRDSLSCHFGSPLKEKRISSGDYYPKKFINLFIIIIPIILSQWKTPKKTYMGNKNLPKNLIYSLIFPFI